MTGAERGFLLLTSQLGDPERKPLTVAQFRELSLRTGSRICAEPDREMNVQDFVSLGYDRKTARHLWLLLQDTQLLEHYLLRAKKAGCVPITRATAAYPAAVRKRLGLDSPGTLWAKGDDSLLNRPGIALVGSRDLQRENAAFAREVGRQAALQGYVLVSGNARGADQIAQNACLEAGGKVISVVADRLADHACRENMLYLSEYGFDEVFSALRALRRNRVIQSMGAVTLVAQSGCRMGGTWDGTEKNLRYGWSPVFCYADGSPAQRMLMDLGAGEVDLADLQDLSSLIRQRRSLFDQ